MKSPQHFLRYFTPTPPHIIPGCMKYYLSEGGWLLFICDFAETREKNENFGSSLLLANSPMSPKIVNGSFAAIFDNSDVLMEFARKFSQLRLDVKDSPGT